MIEREKDREIDIETFTRFEYLERFCKVQNIDLIWKGNVLIITERV